MTLRWRQQYAAAGLHGGQLGELVAEAAGPLRAAAATLLELEGKPFDSPKQALETIAAGSSVAGARNAAQRQPGPGRRPPRRRSPRPPCFA